MHLAFEWEFPESTLKSCDAITAEIVSSQATYVNFRNRANALNHEPGPISGLPNVDHTLHSAVAKFPKVVVYLKFKVRELWFGIAHSSLPNDNLPNIERWRFLLIVCSSKKWARRNWISIINGRNFIKCYSIVQPGEKERCFRAARILLYRKDEEKIKRGSFFEKSFFFIKFEKYR